MLPGLATGPDADVDFVLNKGLDEIGAEQDRFVARPDGTIAASALFAYRDRKVTVPLAASLTIAADGSLVRYAVWGSTSRFTGLDELVERRADGAYDITRGTERARVAAAPNAIVAPGYAPMLMQALALRVWNQRGRPAKLPTLEGGELEISSRGKEAYQLGGKSLELEHVAIHGLVWGFEDVWLDDRGLVAVVTAMPNSIITKPRAAGSRRCCPSSSGPPASTASNGSRS